MKILITGGAGFIGVNCAAYFQRQGNEVIIFDNLSRAGTTQNAEWLAAHHPCRLIRGDIRNYNEINRVFMEHGPFELIIHLAAQVAVTTSVANPREDFEINALGTFNLLEAARLLNEEAVVIYASTNKVYGGMEDLRIAEIAGRYAYHDHPEGIAEIRPLDFHSPYGCSKGAADQYCRDYYRIYGLQTIVMRQSCIYGYHQFGVEDQGWVAWFCIAAALGSGITIYGDGKQVRDVLFIDDLVRAYEAAYRERETVAGKVLNIGGGPDNTLSLLELLSLLERLKGEKIPVAYGDWRPGDQKIFCCDISAAASMLAWKPTVTPETGTERLFAWVQANKGLF